MTPTAPSLPAEATAALAGLPAHRRRLFEARTERWLPDLDEALAHLYAGAGEVRDRLLTLAATAYAARSDDLHDLDLRRSLAPDWFQRPEMVGYAGYTERFAGTLRGVVDRVAYLESLGVRYLHLAPLLTPRPAPSDGGYAVQDYRSVRSDLGTVGDLEALTTSLRERGISLCLDLVLNHVAREHEWAVKARAGDPRYRAYFHVYDDRRVPDAYEQSLPEVFPDFAPGNFTFDDELDGWVWTTFNEYQWDVDWANPDVLCEYADLVLLHANHGVEVFRLDAIAFTWKRMGTSCQNQPEVHDLTQALRTVARIACPAVLFKAEAIVGPRDLMPYLGTGRHHGKVSDLAYHNSLMVQVWSMLASREVGLASHALQQLTPPPSTTAWITYARCHDDIGWAIDDGDAADLGITGYGHRRFLSDFYGGDFPGSWARGLVFQENPQTHDRRISGTLASLAGVEAGDPLGVERIRLVNALVMGFGGIPVIWSGDELGLVNDPGWADDPAHAEDNRWAHRPALPAEPTADQRAVLELTRRTASARAATPHLHASIPAQVLHPRDPGVLLVLRAHPLGALLGAYNVTDTPRPVPVEVLWSVGLDPDRLLDRLTGESVPVRGGAVALPAYGALWLTAG